MPLKRKVKSSRSAAARRPRPREPGASDVKKGPEKKTNEQSPAAEPELLMDAEPPAVSKISSPVLNCSVDVVPCVPRSPSTDTDGGVEEPVGPELANDSEMVEAQSIIARLRRKYHPVDDSPERNVRDIITSGEVEERHVTGYGIQPQSPTRTKSPPDPALEYEFIESQEDTGVDGVPHGKENRHAGQGRSRKGQRGKPVPRKAQKEPLRAPSRRKREEHASSSTFKTPAKRPARSKPTVPSPVVRVPRPTLGHSTPSVDEEAEARRQSLFGFEALESPLTLSPVSASPYIQSTTFRSPEAKKETKPKYPKLQLQGINGIPIRKPSPKKHYGRRRKDAINRSSEIDAWAKVLQAEFAEVDKFELVVE